MKKFKKLRRVASIAAVCAVMTFAFSTNASALSVSDGIKAEITVDAQTDNSAQITAEVKNANYYAVNGVNVKLTVSDNAKLDGETEKTDISLDGETSEILKAGLTVEEEEATNPAENSTKPTDDNTKPTAEPTTDAPSATQPATNSVVLKNPDKTDSSSIKTGESGAALIAVFAVALIAFAMVFAFKRKNKKMLSIVLCFTITGSALVFALPANAAENELLTITDELVVNLGGKDVTLTFTVEYPQQAEIHDNSLEDIAKLNGKEPEVIYNDKGEISFLNGKFTDYKITNWETALSSVVSVESIFNIKEQDVAVLELREQENDNGDTYYTFQQMNAALPIYNALFTIGADKDGNALCISSSIDPTAGYVELDDYENMITPERAEEVAKAYSEKFGWEYVDREPRLEITEFGDSGDYALCWIAYLNGADESSHDIYLKLFINTTNAVVVNTLFTYAFTDESYNYAGKNEIYFETETELMDFVTYDGRTVQLPVAKTEDGKYYFCDTERKILGANHSTTVKAEGNLLIPDPYTFETPEDLDPIFVSVLYNLTRTYDYFQSVGVKSIDGAGLPILALLDFRDELGNKDENACYDSNAGGWGTFIFGQFPVSASFDVVAHEYTHGVKISCTGSAKYENTTGAIEEAYADIFGNMTEMIVDPEHSDAEQWIIGEGGKKLRNMSNPHEYLQPEYIGDAYYAVDAKTPSGVNDHGGVHMNNSILSKMCFDMYNISKMSMEGYFNIWRDTFFVFNPDADYDDVRAYLKYSLERNNRSDLVDDLQNLFVKANAVNAEKFSWDNMQAPEGCTKITLICKDMPDNYEWGVSVTNEISHTVAPQSSKGICVCVVENGSYDLISRYQILNSEQPFIEYYNWLPQSKNKPINISGGEMTFEFAFDELLDYV